MRARFSSRNVSFFNLSIRANGDSREVNIPNWVIRCLQSSGSGVVHILVQTWEVRNWRTVKEILKSIVECQYQDKMAQKTKVGMNVEKNALAAKHFTTIEEGESKYLAPRRQRRGQIRWDRGRSRELFPQGVDLDQLRTWSMISDLSPKSLQPLWVFLCSPPVFSVPKKRKNVFLAQQSCYSL